jgi:hypothetical protein
MPLPDKYYFSGTPEQLSMLLPFAQIVHKALEGLEVDAGGGTPKELAPKRSSKILIKLVFFGLSVQGRRKSVETRFRLMKDDPKTITLARIQFLARQIHQRFNNWEHTTGKRLACYADWDNGYQLQLQVPSLAEAQRIVEQVLDIQSHSPDWTNLTIDQNANEESRYPVLPDKVQIANTSIRPSQQRVTAKVRFTRALIKFPHIPRFVQICTKKGDIIPNLSFLGDYTD